MTYAQRDAGYYTIGGQRYPSITTVLSPLKPEYPTDPKYRDRGSLVHLAMQAQVIDLIGTAYIDDWCEMQIQRNGFAISVPYALPSATCAVEWCAEYIVSAERVEEPGVNFTWGIAGTPDVFRAVLIDGTVITIDGKTQATTSPDRWHICQGAAQNRLESVAYADGRYELYGECDLFGNLYITPAGAQLRTWTAAQVEDAWVRCVVPLLTRRQVDQRYDDPRDIPPFLAQGYAIAGQSIKEWCSERRRAGYWPPREPKPKPQPRRRVTAAERRVAAGAALWYGDRAEV